MTTRENDWRATAAMCASVVYLMTWSACLGIRMADWLTSSLPGPGLDALPPPLPITSLSDCSVLWVGCVAVYCLGRLRGMWR